MEIERERAGGREGKRTVEQGGGVRYRGLYGTSRLLVTLPYPGERDIEATLPPLNTKICIQPTRPLIKTPSLSITFQQLRSHLLQTEQIFPLSCSVPEADLGKTRQERIRKITPRIGW